MPTPRHKVFLSFHHGDCAVDTRCGQYWKEKFERLFTDRHNLFVHHTVDDTVMGDGTKVDIIRKRIRDEYIADATVTVVLVGPDTWKHKHVDWEISSSIRDTKNHPRCGLLGILLPTYLGPLSPPYDHHTLPPRLSDNLRCGYASLHYWSENPVTVQRWIHDAYLRRYKVDPLNSRAMFVADCAEAQTRWPSSATPKA